MIESEFVSFGEHGRVKLVNLGDEGLRRIWSMKPILVMRVFDGNDLVRFIAVKCEVGVFENLIGEFTGEAEKKCVLQLHDLPGGVKAFLLIAKFCYGVKIDTALNVVSLRCAAEYLRMSEEYGEGNLTILTENFLNEVFGNWTDSVRALEAREEVLPHVEELHIVSRCINSLAMKACADPSLFRRYFVMEWNKRNSQVTASD
ncbi:hypothetical protein Q3G72_030243 [Acer saccharum]|nr:hypothetical protein Q3G72_030243 [Acer saccharum]